MESIPVVDAAAVGLGDGGFDGFSGHGGLEGGADVVFGLGGVLGVAGVVVIHGAEVDQLAGGVDDGDGRGGLGAEGLADGAVGIQGHGGGLGLLVGGQLVGFLGAGVGALLGAGGIDGDPDDALGGPGFLQLLHVAALVVGDDVGAAVVQPFEDDVLALEAGQGVFDALGVLEGEIRCGLAHLGGGVGGHAGDGQSGNQGQQTTGHGMQHGFLLVGFGRITLPGIVQSQFPAAVSSDPRT